MVYGIVKQNRGFINVHSEPGKGTTFRIYLPAYTPPETHDAPITTRDNKIPGGVETILIVEDEAAILKMTGMMLERLGYNVLTASTPGEANRVADEYSGEIHLLISDVIMPEINGRDLAARLASRFPGLKCLFMSGYTADVIAHQGVLDENMHFLQKPFSRQALGEKVREPLQSP